MRTLFAALLLGSALATAAPALAKNAPPPSPYAPLQDRPSCTRDQLKPAAAYLEAQRRGDLTGLTLATRCSFFRKYGDAGAMSFHDDKRCNTFTWILRDRGWPFLRR